jgi:hypothetical protein
MLRHSCGDYLADRGTDLRTMQDYSGTAIKSTRRTTRALPGTGSRDCGASPWAKCRRASRPSCDRERQEKSPTHGAIRSSAACRTILPGQVR